MKRVHGKRAVFAPTQRWTPSRKEKVLSDLRTATDTKRDELMAEHGLTEAEVASWERGFERAGRRGLRAQQVENRPC